MSRVFMLKPADGIEGVKNAILTAVQDAGPNACPPMVVGVGIGGTFEKCALMAKDALTREVGTPVSYTHLLIGFNPKFLIDALRVIDDEEVTLYLMNAKAPCFIKDETESYIYLILPVNFNANV